jgi:hypothetical protein
VEALDEQSLNGRRQGRVSHESLRTVLSALKILVDLILVEISSDRLDTFRPLRLIQTSSGIPSVLRFCGFRNISNFSNLFLASDLALAIFCGRVADINLELLVDLQEDFLKGGNGNTITDNAKVVQFIIKLGKELGEAVGRFV